MHAIHIGGGLRSKLWLRAVEKHPKVQSVAVVNSTGRSPGGIQGLPAYSSLADALGNVQADLAITSGCEAVSRGIDALEAGLDVIVDEPGRLNRQDLERLQALSGQTESRLVCVRRYPYSRCERTLRRFLDSGRLGALGHVSCDDRRDVGADVPVDGQTQLSLFGCDHFYGLQRVLGVKIIAVMARLQGEVATTEAFLEMEQGIHVHYFGSARSEVNAHNLWLEGSKGSLKTDGVNVWWRKHGWRFFAPVHIGLSRSPAELGDGPRLLDEFIVATASADRADDQNTLAGLAIAAAAVESSQRHRVVAVPASHPVRNV